MHEHSKTEKNLVPETYSAVRKRIDPKAIFSKVMETNVETKTKQKNQNI